MYGVLGWVGLEVDVRWLSVVRCEDLSERGWFLTEGNLREFGAVWMSKVEAGAK